jgi:succinate dehydrogenase / fumarate reductase membrane anchor subunit
MTGESKTSAYRTPLGRARGLGSAKSGVARHIGMVVTSVALLFLVLWGLWSALILAGSGYMGAVRWLASPVDAALLALLAIVGFHHMRMGMSVIIEDYIGKTATRALLLIANALVCWGAMILTVVCVLKVAFISRGFRL